MQEIDTGDTDTGDTGERTHSGDDAVVRRARELADELLFPAGLAMTAASALVAARGGRGVSLTDHAQLLHREAMFLLVFGQTSTIRGAQLAQYLGTPGAG